MLRRPDELPIDEDVAAQCEIVREVARVPVGRSLSVAWRERRRALALAQGQPLWAASILTRDFGRKLVELCSDWRPDVVQAELDVMSAYLPFAARPARRVLVDHDPSLRRNGTTFTLWRRRRLARRSAADAVVVFTAEDESALRPVVPPDIPIATIPMAWREERPALDPVGSDPPTVLFVGSYRHPPNLSAARRLAALVPELRREVPEAVVALVGEDPPPDLARSGALVPGRVDDVEPWLSAAALVAAPLVDGGGTRVKVVEALAAGKAVVGTARAFEGLDVVNGRDAVIADSDSFGRTVIELLGDPERRRQLGEAARAWAQRMPSGDDVEDAYASLYDSLGAE